MSSNRIDVKQILADSRKSRIGLPALNYSDIWDLLAIVNAAERMQVNVMACSNGLVADVLGLDVCQAMVSALNANSRVSIINHLDHGSGVAQCIRAIEAGYPSVMIDGSKHPLEENIRMTAEVVGYAHKNGVIVEGEIGKIKGKGIEGDFAGGAFLAEVDEAVELVARTGIDTLAVGIGTAHGFYTETPKIHFDRLEELAAAIDIPLVLHGGTGIPDDDIRKAIRLGIVKVNVGTMIHATYLKHLKIELDQAGDDPYTLDVMAEVLPHIEAVIMDRIHVITTVACPEPR